MKRFISIVMLGMFSMAIAGCEANAKVGDPDTTDHDTSVKKETTIHHDSDGDRSVKTETKVEHY